MDFENMFICNSLADDIKNVWMKLWKDFKDYTRRTQMCKSGDGTKKGMDPKQVQLMEKMNGFEIYVPDLFSNIISSLSRNATVANNDLKSIWQPVTDKPCQSRKRRIPPVSEHYSDLEDKKNKLFEMMVHFKDTMNDLSNQSKILIASNTQSSQSAASPGDGAKNNLQKSLLNIIDPYFVNLNGEKRAICFEEMLKVFE